MNPPVRAVIFDLDGTLFDHEGSAAEALRHWLPQLGVTPDEAIIDTWFAIEEGHHPTWVAGEVGLAEMRRRRLRQFLPTLGLEPGGSEMLDALFAGYLDCYRRAWVRFDDVEAAITTLSEADIQMAVLTNGPDELQQAKVEAIGLAGRVGPVFTAEALGEGKPATSAYLTVCRHLRADPPRVLHVGDRYDLDVLAPRSAGLQALHLDRSDKGPHRETERIRRLDQLSLPV